MKEIIVTKNEAGQRLDKLLAKYLDAAPKSFLYKMLRKKNIKLNKKKADGKELLQVGDSVAIFLADDTIKKFQKQERQETKTHLHLEHLYQDDNVLILNKPVGVLSQKARSDDVSVNDYVLEVCGQTGKTFRPSICNRLDRNTSGIIVSGVSLEGLQTMAELLKSREVHKYYQTIVKGRITEEKKITGYLKKNEKNNTVEFSKKRTAGSAYIETWYTPIKVGRDATLLEVWLITGRTHQIRAHLASVGHPVAGDYKYGDRKWNDQLKQQFGLFSQLLHSARLVFPEKMERCRDLSGRTIIAAKPELFCDIEKTLFDDKK